MNVVLRGVGGSRRGYEYKNHAHSSNQRSAKIGQGRIKPEHAAKNLADQGELYENLNQQPNPKNAPPGGRANRWNDIGGIECKLLQRKHNRKNEEGRVLLVKAAPKNKDGQNEEQEIGRNPKVMPEQ